MLVQGGGLFGRSVQLKPLALPPPKVLRPQATQPGPTAAAAAAAATAAAAASDAPGSTPTSASTASAADPHRLVVSNVKLTGGRPTSFVISADTSDASDASDANDSQGEPPSQDASTDPSAADADSAGDLERLLPPSPSPSHFKRDRSSTLVAPPKPPPSAIPAYDFVYAEHDSLETELNEFYSYHDFALCARGRALWEKDLDHGSTTSDIIQELTDRLLTRQSSHRIAAANKLLYFAQGLFTETQSTEQHINSIKTNNQLLFKLDVFPVVYQAFRAASLAFDNLAKLASLTAEDQLALDLNILETTAYLSTMYLIVVSNMDNPDFVTEIATTDPYLPVFLFQILSQLAEGNRQHYPVKKVSPLMTTHSKTAASASDHDIMQLLLLLWKLIPSRTTVQYLKSTPQDYQNYFILLSHRYPGYYLPEPLEHLPGQVAHFYDPPPTPIPAYAGYQLQPLASGIDTLPRAVHEAVNLYRDKLYVSAAAVQMVAEKDSMMRQASQEMHAGLNGQAAPTQLSPGLERYRDLYSSLHANMGSYLSMLVRLLYYLNIGMAADAGAANGRPSTGGHGSGNGHEPATPVVTTQDIRGMGAEERMNTLERLDSNRHREVLTHAISGLVLALLKASKCYNVMAFENICMQLVDNNCAILILKMLSSWFPNPGGPKSANAGGPVASAGSDHSGSESKRDSVGAAWLRARTDPIQLNFVDFCRGGPAFEGAMAGDAGPGHMSSPVPSPMLQDPLPNARRDFDLDIPSVHSSLSATGMHPSCFRAFSTTINLLRILQKLTKHKTHRVLSLVTWKASAVLKRILRVNHAGLVLYALKLLKSQIPHLGRKWRSNNTRIVTLIYTHLRPMLREEYLMGEMEANHDEALVHEQHLRALVGAFHARNFPQPSPPALLPLLSTSDYSGHGHSHSRQPPSMGTPPDDLDLALKLAAKGTFDSSNPYHASLLNSPAGASSLFSPHYGSSRSSHLHGSGQAHDSQLDDNFKKHYQEWLQREVFEPQPSWYLSAERTAGTTSPDAALDAYNRHHDKYYGVSSSDVSGNSSATATGTPNTGIGSPSRDARTAAAAAAADHPLAPVDANRVADTDGRGSSAHLEPGRPLTHAQQTQQAQGLQPYAHMSLHPILDRAASATSRDADDMLSEVGEAVWAADDDYDELYEDEYAYDDDDEDDDSGGGSGSPDGRGYRSFEDDELHGDMDALELDAVDDDDDDDDDEEGEEEEEFEQVDGDDGVMVDETGSSGSAASTGSSGSSGDGTLQTLASPVSTRARSPLVSKRAEHRKQPLSEFDEGWTDGYGPADADTNNWP
ncbi:hypothetical protein BC831DRAFT_486512 [Entophlyctis helioformis]|nr:hypothetical protein BC831DRAFT_486512 [Entophlyctis helioformis]